MADGYLSDDQEMRLRMTAPVTCRLCRHLVARVSVITEEKLVYCGKPQDGPNAEIIAYLLQKQAATSRKCPFADLFSELL